MKINLVENSVNVNKQPDYTKLNFSGSMRTNRMPLKGYRKETDCQVKNKCYNAAKIRILKDSYATCSTLGARCGRTAKPLIRSGMQHKLDENNKKVDYSYSYREYMHNKKNMTYDRKLRSKYINKGFNNVWGSSGGNCASKNCINKTISKLNNTNFSKQGAVDSSLRLMKLKMDTIVSESVCTLEGYEEKCNGTYFAGNPRFTGFNNKHLEINCPQNKARDGVLGNIRNKKC